MERRIIPSLDIAKFICSFLVVAIHCAPLAGINDDANFVLVQVIARLAVPLYFVISGYLFFAKIDRSREWNDVENINKLKHTLWRLLKIYLIYTILYFPFSLLLMKDQGLVASDFLLYFRDIIFAGSYYHLWFLPALMFAIAFVYWLSKRFKPLGILLVGIILYLLGMVLNIYGAVLPDIIQPVVNGYNDIFVSARNGLFFGVMYVGIGAYFAYNNHHVNSNKLGGWALFIIGLIGLFGECFMLKQAGIMHDLASMYIMLIPCVSGLFAILLSCSMTKFAYSKVFRASSLMIYTIHLMPIIAINVIMPSLPSLLVYFIACISSLVFAITVYALSKKVRILRILY